MDLSVVIVSYNAADFLRLCLKSVRAACSQIACEVFVVDNNSSDHSVKVVQDEFSEFFLIANKHNPGFAIANNQAIQKSKGKYVLLLNPDTVVSEDTFIKIVDFMNNQPNSGGLGVYMIDGIGVFLPESKRGLPSPWASFSKMTGLSKLFPHSKIFNEYHKGYLSNNENHKIEILSGAFMCMKKEVLDRVGLLDEDFFMYGEDIDLSYRIIKSGYQNYYFADTSIIHFKGESTCKDAKYRQRFYKAMIQFAEKHFDKGNGMLLKWFIFIGVHIAKILSKITFKKTQQKHNANLTENACIFNHNKIDSDYFKNNRVVTASDLDRMSGGVLIFIIGKTTYRTMIEIMMKYSEKFQFRFFDEETNILIGSDSKWAKGSVVKV